ncbi:MAG: NADP-dependent phosphogluconate dehydrogenase [Ferruginibacter sp.]
MSSSLYEFGMIGLGTMGQNLVLNMSDNGFSVAGYDKNNKQVDALNAQAKERAVKAFDQLDLFVAALETPRVIMLLIPAGAIVDAVISELTPYLSKDDVIMDCGNSHFVDTALRAINLGKEDIHFVGTGVSGGESGARFGPSLMPGGDTKVYERLKKMLEAVSAKVHGQPCVAYMGNGAAGHYVKMVHNGIEYALMQLIAESYHLMKKFVGLSNEEIYEVFDNWSKGKLNSFLIEITAVIFTQQDDKGDGKLIDKIADTAHQKGTGAWMSEDAMQIMAPIPAIDASVTQRIISSLKAERIQASANNDQTTATITTNKKDFLSQLEDALHAAFMITYAQGLSMLQAASDTHKFNTDIPTVASIWRGGCIIRAAMLEDITTAYTREPGLKNLLLSETFSVVLNKEIYSLRGILKAAINCGIPVPAFYACNSYFESYNSAWLPANLIQAQRDFFGAHTYERIDAPGSFHTIWNQIIQ